MSKPDTATPNRALGGQTEEHLLNLFFVLYKSARIIDESNDAFKRQLSGFMEEFRAVSGERAELEIKRVGGHFFVNERMVRFDIHGRSGAASIIDEWDQLRLGGVRFEADIDEDTAASFFKSISEIRPDSHNLESAAQQLAENGIAQVKLLSIEQESDEPSAVSEEERKRFRQMARNTFFKSVAVVQETMGRARDGEDINVAKTKRVIHSLIDHITRDEQSMIELTSIRDFDDYTYAHSTNVAVYSLAVGVRLGLDRARLSQLGFAALFHDIGKVKLPYDLIRKPDAFDENDWVQMQRHPLLGAKTILRNLRIDIHTARAARAAFEHHINNDFTGYPMLHYDRRPANLFSKIVSIVDTFDALTSGRVYLKKNMAPDTVLKKMRYQMADKFDPFLLKLFNDIIGVYPAGSLVLLSTDEIALILTNNEEDPLRPHVKVVGDRNGILTEPFWIDLSQPEHNDRRLVRLLDPERYGLSSRDFILED